MDEATRGGLGRCRAVGSPSEKERIKLRATYLNADAERALEEATTGSAELADDRETLAEAEVVEPSRAILAEADAAAVALDGARRAADAATRATASESHGNAAAACEVSGAVWAQAERLDADVGAASTELDAAEGRAAASKAEAERRREGLDASEGERAALARERAHVAAELAGRPGSVLLAERADAVAALVAERTSAEGDVTALEAELPGLEAEARRLAGDVAGVKSSHPLQLTTRRRRPYYAVARPTER